MAEFRPLEHAEVEVASEHDLWLLREYADEARLGNTGFILAKTQPDPATRRNILSAAVESLGGKLLRSEANRATNGMFDATLDIALAREHSMGQHFAERDRTLDLRRYSVRSDLDTSATLQPFRPPRSTTQTELPLVHRYIHSGSGYLLGAQLVLTDEELSASVKGNDEIPLQFEGATFEEVANETGRVVFTAGDIIIFMGRGTRLDAYGFSTPVWPIVEQLWPTGGPVLAVTQGGGE